MCGGEKHQSMPEFPIFCSHLGTEHSSVIYFFKHTTSSLFSLSLPPLSSFIAQFLDRAKEAQTILNARPKAPADALRYAALEVQFFGRMGCPYCVQALDLLKERGLPLVVELTSSTPLTPKKTAAAASATGGSGSGGGGSAYGAVRPGTMLDVEK